MGTLFNNRFTRPLDSPLMRMLAWTAAGRGVVYGLWRGLSYRRKEAFFWRFANAFRDVDLANFKEGEWPVEFCGRRFRLPLTRDRLWERWGLALSALGHDSDVKETYENLVLSPNPPQVFLDIGANMGTHSFLMAACGLKVVSIEPNPVCVDYADRVRSLNDLEVQWLGVAAGAEQKDVVLNFPAGDPSLGAIGDGAATPGLESVVVPMKRVDDLTLPAGDLLIKIDAEGYELNVLRGAEKTLKNRRPRIIFECNHNDPAGGAVFRHLAERGYDIFRLPWSPGMANGQVKDIAAESGTNFIASPKP